MRSPTAPSLLRAAADLMRLAALASAVATFLWLPSGGAWRFLGLFALMLLPRLSRLAPLFDLAFGATLLLATWAGVRDWYVTVVWMDEVVHFVTVAAVTVTCYLALAKWRVLPEPTVVADRDRVATVPLLVTMLGFTVAALWEFVEWVAEQVTPRAIHVGYDDTILDLALGGLGALVAGTFLWFRRRRSTGRPPGTRNPRSQRSEL